MKLSASRWSFVVCLAGLLAVLSLPGRLSAQVVFYGYNYNTDSIYSINPLTQTDTLLGATGLSGVTLQGLAISPAGVIYATSSIGQLYTINSTTGVATFIGSTGRGDVEGLDFMGSTLIGVTSGINPTIFSINTSTAGTANLISLGGAGLVSDTARAMAVVDGTTVLISTYSSGSQANLYSANVSTGVVTFVGLMNVSVGQFASMDIGYDGVLYGFTNDGTVYQIDQATAATTLLGTISGSPFWLDVTTQAIPEPSTWALLLAGSGALWLARRRART